MPDVLYMGINSAFGALGNRVQAVLKQLKPAEHLRCLFGQKHHYVPFGSRHNDRLAVNEHPVLYFRDMQLLVSKTVAVLSALLPGGRRTASFKHRFHPQYELTG